jgi:hypothetical protein
MLIAIAIAALVIAVAVRAHLGIERAQQHAAAGLDRSRIAEILLGRLERELLGAVLVKRPDGEERLGHPWVFVGTDGASEGMDTDSLRFVTRTPARAGVSIPASGISIVSYVASSSDDGGLELRRDEQPLEGGLQTRVDASSGQLVADGLAGFDLRFQDEVGSTRESWNSTDLVMLDQLPLSVDIRVRLLEEGRDGEWVEGPERARTVQLRVRPIDLEALRAGALQAGESECLTAEQCVERYSAYLSRGDDARDELMELLAQTAGECFELESELADALRNIGGPDPAETCR